MKQGIVGGLLFVGGVILSPFGPQVLGWVSTLSLMVFSVTLSAGNYAWTLWAHGGSDTFLWFFLVALWALLLVDAAFLLVWAVFLAMEAVRVFALNQTRKTGEFYEFISCLGYSWVSFSISFIFLCFVGLVDIGVGAWTTQPSLSTEDTYKFMFFWGVKGYLYVYPISMVVAGLYILMDSSRKLARSIRHG